MNDRFKFREWGKKRGSRWSNMVEVARGSWAWLFGYFWMPCPICGRMFGGFEISPVTLMFDWHMGRCVCRKCTGRAIEANKESGLFLGVGE